MSVDHKTRNFEFRMQVATVACYLLRYVAVYSACFICSQLLLIDACFLRYITCKCIARVSIYETPVMRDIDDGYPQSIQFNIDRLIETNMKSQQRHAQQDQHSLQLQLLARSCAGKLCNCLPIAKLTMISYACLLINVFC